MAEPTARQGQFLSFILGFTDKRGYAPSYEEIGWHFGLTAPSVNSMIKMLERRGFLSRMPGVARSLRVLVPAAALPGSDFGPTGSKRRAGKVPASPGAVAIAVLDALEPLLAAQSKTGRARAGATAAQALHATLLGFGCTEEQAADAAGRVRESR